jgi:hypothetical protein
MTSKTSAATDVARWMLDELNRDDYLSQESTVYLIQQKFGPDFVYYNSNGNLAIARDVLAAFRKLTSTNVVWSRGERMWRKREGYDSETRQQN